MRIISRNPVTGRKCVREFQTWQELVNEAWRQYRLNRPAYLLNVATDAAWRALDDVLP